MASVHRTKRSKYWYGSVTLPGRKQILRSTGQTDKAQALKIAMEWERVAKGNRLHSAEQARRVLTDIVKMTMGEFKESCGCAEYVERWLAAAKGTVADTTLQFYKSTLQAWVTWLGERAKQPLEAVSKEDIVNWRDFEAKRVRSRTANHRLKAVRALFRAAVGEGFVAANPAEGLKILRSPTREKRARRPFTREELRKVMAAADPTWKLMILAGLQTGQRLGDIARMDWEELELSVGVWDVTTAKTGTQLRIPLSAELKAALLGRKKGAGHAVKKGPVFPELVERMARASDRVGPLSNAFADILFGVGLRTARSRDRAPKETRAKSDPSGHDRRAQHELSFHSLRHTARTWLEEAGQPKAVIDALIGHEGDTGKIYTTVGEEALRTAAATLAAAAA